MTDRLSYIDVYNAKETDIVNPGTNNESIIKIENENQVLNANKIGVLLEKNTRYFIFTILVITNLIINMDHGTIPAATSEIKRDLKVDDDTLGIFGSLVYLGNLIGKYPFVK